MTKTVKEVLATGKRGGRKGGGSKKHGRHRDHCARYRAEGRREKNKAHKMKKDAKMKAKNRVQPKKGGNEAP